MTPQTNRRTISWTGLASFRPARSCLDATAAARGRNGVAPPNPVPLSNSDDDDEQENNGKNADTNGDAGEQEPEEFYCV